MGFGGVCNENGGGGRQKKIKSVRGAKGGHPK